MLAKIRLSEAKRDQVGRLLRHHLAVAALLSLASANVMAADPLDKKIHLDIAPNTALDDALIQWGSQVGMQVMVATDSIAQQKTDGVRGVLPAGAALSALLRDSGLSYSAAGNTVAVIPIRLAEASSKKTSVTAPGDSRGAANADVQGGGGDSSRSGSRGLEEVVVTAQRREERMQDVPISISVLSGSDLDKSPVQGVTEALASVPGVSTFAHSQGGGTFVTVRGVSASGPVFGGSSPIAYYLDSVPFGLVQTAIAPDANSYDLGRVEVLRGPQGTLYGASAQNGVVRVLTQDANLDKFEFKARGALSSTDVASNNYRGDMAVNVPIVDGKVAARAVLGYQNLSGWIDQPIKNDSNNANLRSARLKVNARPTDRLSIGASAWMSRDDFGGMNAGDDNNFRNHFVDESIANDYDVYGFKVGYDFDSFAVSSSTGYIDYSSASAVDASEGAGAPFPVATHFSANVISEEISLTSSRAGPWRWSAGGMYRDAQDKTRQTLSRIGVVFPFTNTSKSSAVFGELSRRFAGNALEWTLGARYFRDKVATREDPVMPPANRLFYYSAEDTFSASTPRAVLTWYPREDLTFYTSYSQGFRSGTPEPYYITGGVPGLPSVKPDKLRNYEVGAKGALADGRITIDSAVFYVDWKDVQQQLTIPFNGTPSGVTALVNGNSASGMGVDLGLTTVPVDGLELGINFNWNDLKMDTDVFSGGVVLFSKGDRLNFSPEYTAGASASYSFPIGGGGYTGRFAANGSYTSSQSFRTITNGAQRIVAGDTILITRASFSIQSPGSWDVTLFGDNLNNEKGTVFGSPFSRFAYSNVRVRPRTIGLQLDYHFQ